MNELSIQIKNLTKKFAPGYYQSIDVDEGWYQIVLDCDKELSAIDPDYIILQVKQKFGGLRYYCQSSQPDNPELFAQINSIIKKYENIAAVTCEVTGNPGVLMKSETGWHKTLDALWAESTLFHKNYTVVDKTPLNESQSESDIQLWKKIADDWRKTSLALAQDLGNQDIAIDLYEDIRSGLYDTIRERMLPNATLPEFFDGLHDYASLLSTKAGEAQELRVAAEDISDAENTYYWEGYEAALDFAIDSLPNYNN
jgi:hypothetical protein